MVAAGCRSSLEPFDRHCPGLERFDAFLTPVCDPPHRNPHVTETASNL